MSQGYAFAVNNIYNHYHIILMDITVCNEVDSKCLFDV